MNSPNDKEAELRRREKELQEREQSIRLREMEAELYQKEQPSSSLAPTRKHEKPAGNLQQRYRQLFNVAKFLGIVVAVVIAVRIASWLAMIVMVGGVAWVAYKLFLEKDRSRP